MARVEIPVTQVNVSGVARPAQTVGNASENNYIADNSGDVILEVENSSTTTTYKVTFPTPATVGGVNVEDEIVSLAKETTQVVGPFPPQVFNQGADNGRLYVNPENGALKFRAYRV